MSRFLKIVTTLSNNVLDELKKEGQHKEEIDSMKSSLVNSDAPTDVKEASQKSGALITELESLKEQLSKAKIDNLCIRIAYERWKQTYERLDVLKGRSLPHEASLD